MITPMVNESRLQYLSRVLTAYMEKYGDFTIDYDETTCDGECLAQDIAIAVEVEHE